MANNLAAALGIIICPHCNIDVTDKVRENFVDSQVHTVTHCTGYEDQEPHRKKVTDMCSMCTIIITREEYEKKYTK